MSFFKSDSVSIVSNSVCTVSEFSISAWADFDKSIFAVTLFDFVLFYTVHFGFISDNSILQVLSL